MTFAGIGNPINFFNLLKKNNINVIEEKGFPDHHNYSEKELEDLINKAKEKNSILLTTEKDYFRINQEYKKNINFLTFLPNIHGGQETLFLLQYLFYCLLINQKNSRDCQFLQKQ